MLPLAAAAQRPTSFAMNEDIPLPFDLPAVARKKVSAAFDGGRITSDGCCWRGRSGASACSWCIVNVIALVVLWRLRYKLSLRDLAEMFLIRGLVFSYEAVRDWEAKLTRALAENLRRRRKGKVGRSWYVDETYIRVRGGWRYLYRAIDRAGALVDVMLSEHRDLAAANAFFRSAKAVTGVTPDRVTTDGHDAYPRAIRTELGRHVRHRTNRYLNNRLEQDHRGIKGRCRPMLGLKI